MFILIGGGFRSLMTFSVVAFWAFYFLTVSHRQDKTYKMLIIVRVGSGTCNITCQGASPRKVSLCGSHMVTTVWGFDDLTKRLDLTRRG